MSELTDILDELKALGFVMNSPASQDQLDYLQQNFGFPSDPNPKPYAKRHLSEEILELYRHHNGMPLGRKPLNRNNWPLFDMRLMSIEEARQYNIVMRWFFGQDERATILETACFLWVDDQSNAMGIYTRGKQQGKIFIWHHEFSDPSPRFRSIESMYKQWLKCARLNNEAELDEDAEPIYCIVDWQGEQPYGESIYTDYPESLKND